jgi:hypothetical protein
LFSHLLDVTERCVLLAGHNLVREIAALDFSSKPGDGHPAEGECEFNRLLQTQRGV